MAYSELSYAEVSQDPDAELRNPRRQRKPRFLGWYNAGGRLGSTGLFFATAALSGFVCYLAFSFFFPSRPPPSHLPPGWHLVSDGTEATSGHLTDSTPYWTGPTDDELWSADNSPMAPPLDYHEMSIEELSAMVATTKGYFVRDYSLSLGWNNVRSIQMCHVHCIY